MGTTVALLGALIGALVLGIMVGLLRRDAEGRLRPFELLSGALAGAVMGGLIGYAATPAPMPLMPAPVEEAAVPPEATPPETAMEPALGAAPAPAPATPEAAPAKKPAAKTARKAKRKTNSTATREGVVTAPPPGGAGTCREYTTRIMIDGQMQDAYGTTCQQEDGTWQKVK